MPDTPPPTLRQIAEKAGVDRSTVSLALRNDPRIKAETCKHIQELAAQMGYRANPIVAQLMTQLREGQTSHFHSNLGMIDFGMAPDTPHAELLEGTQKYAYSLGYGLDVFHAREYTPGRLEKILLSRGIRGVIINSLWGNSRLPDGYLSVWPKFSCCVIGAHTTNPEMNFVGDDNYATAMTAVEELRRRGFTRIGLAMHRLINLQTDFRFVAGFLAGNLTHTPIENPPVLLFEPEQKQKFLEWFEHHNPQVVISSQQEIYDWLQEAGYRVPEQVSLVHLDVYFCHQTWAGMLQQRPHWGAAAVNTVLAQLQRRELGAPQVPKAVFVESRWQDGPTLGTPRKI
ncbi:MAG: LacI family DNA-binding transcriptional regulator [Chthoniobacteraceae bacterium]